MRKKSATILRSVIVFLLAGLLLSCSVPNVYFIDSSGILQWNGREKTLEVLWEHRQTGANHSDSIPRSFFKKQPTQVEESANHAQ